MAHGHVLHLSVAPGFYTLVLKTAEGFSTQKIQVMDQPTPIGEMSAPWNQQRVVHLYGGQTVK